MMFLKSKILKLLYFTQQMIIVSICISYSYICPATYNKADFIISILNSDNVLDKNNVNNMCEISSTIKQMDIKYNSFNKDVC
jgi:hypothetical protein